MDQGRRRSGRAAGGGGGGHGRQQESYNNNAGEEGDSYEEEEESYIGDVDHLYGISSVLNTLQAGKRELLTLFTQMGLSPGQRKDKLAVDKILRLAQSADVEIVEQDKGFLNSLCGNRPHQGFVLRARPLTFTSLSALGKVEEEGALGGGPQAGEAGGYGEAEGLAGAEVGGGDEEVAGQQQQQDQQQQAEKGDLLSLLPPIRKDRRVWLALDEISDPQNFGALLRSAYFFGVEGVVTCSKNSAGLTPTVSKASAGALEVMQVHSTSNMMRFLKVSRDNGWRVVGTALGGGPVADLQDVPAGPPTIVVLGNEGYGMRTNVMRECSVLVKIPGAFVDEGAVAASAEGASNRASTAQTSAAVDSLNVSVTGGLMLFHMLGMGGGRGDE